MTFSPEDQEPARGRTPSSATTSGTPTPTRWTERRWWILGVATCLTGVVAIVIAIASSATTSASSPVSTTSAPARSASSTILPRATTQPAPPTTTVSSTAAISRTFNTFLDFDNTSVSDKVAVVEDGSALRQAIAEAVATPFASAAFGSRVDASTLLDSSACALVSLSTPCAQVTYDVVGAKGVVILPGSQGYAVSTNGQWQVAKVTVCGLFELFYQASAKTGTPPGC